LDYKIKKDELDYRYERKFFVSGVDSLTAESFVNLHPAVFSRIFHKRTVNNIYFDTLELNNYFDNVNGNSRRKKIRIRWYGELFGKIKNPTLEIKIKNGLLGRKLRYSLHPFNLNKNFNMDNILQIIQNQKIPESIKTELKFLQPTLLNKYNRKYFLSEDKRYRITIDTKQEFYAINSISNSFIKKIKDKTNIIIELKYDMPSDNGVEKITNAFPFRLTKSSKYITGIKRIFI